MLEISNNMIGPVDCLLSFYHLMIITIIIDETMIVNQPENVTNVFEEVDTRKGFFGHVVLTISWVGPQGIHIYSTVIDTHNHNKMHSIDKRGNMAMFPNSITSSL